MIMSMKNAQRRIKDQRLSCRVVVVVVTQVTAEQQLEIASSYYDAMSSVGDFAWLL